MNVFKPDSKVNRRVFTYLGEPTFDLEPQGRIILNTIRELSPVTRYELVMELTKRLSSVRPVTQSLSYHQRLLERYQCILVQEWWEAKKLRYAV